MVYANGKLPSSALRKVGGVYLSLKSANSFDNMTAAARKDGVSLWPALPDGGYRDYERQGVIGAKNPYSSVAVARPGQSTHGFGTRVDIGSFPPARELNKWGAAGMKRRQWMLEHAHEFGWTREFGESDPNHWKHDGITATQLLDDDDLERIHDNKVKAQYLNHLSKKNDWGILTGTSKDGKRRASYWKLVKRWGAAKGKYSGKVTGVGPTDATAKLEKLLWADAAEWFRGKK